MVMKGREYKGYILVNEDDVAKKAAKKKAR